MTKLTKFAQWIPFIGIFIIGNNIYDDDALCNKYFYSSAIYHGICMIPIVIVLTHFIINLWG